jgi:hypothetical protein
MTKLLKKMMNFDPTILITRILVILVVVLALTGGYTGSKLSLEQRKYQALKIKYDALKATVSASPSPSNL